MVEHTFTAADNPYAPFDVFQHDIIKGSASASVSVLTFCLTLAPKYMKGE